MKKPLIIAHRGFSKEAPENTLTSFKKAIELGVDSIEFDVHLTSDNNLVVHHDYYLGRTNNGHGFIGDYSFSQLRKLDAGSWFSHQFANERIPSLMEVLKLGKKKCRFEIELKTTSEQFVAQIVQTITAFDLENEIEFTSAHLPVLIKLKQLMPIATIGIFFQSPPDWMQKKEWYTQVIEYLSLTEAQVAHLPFSTVDKTIVTLLHKEEKIVHAADCNSSKEISRVMKLGVDQLSTNDPKLALKMRDGKVSSIN